MGRTWSTWWLLAVALSAGCSPPGGDDQTELGRSPLAPSFAPATEAGGGAVETSPRDDSGTTTPLPAGSGTSAGDSTSSSSAAIPVTPSSAHVDDPVGDLTASPTDPPPSWADLRGATLRRLGTEFELAIDVAGDVPARATDADHTMNIASFYDLDGDGQIDSEIWINLADDGWGGAYYDDRAHTAAFARESQVAVRVEQQRLVISFPATHLHDATALRWAVASEWGRYEAIGTPVAARDDVPDDDAAVEFPA